MHTLAARHGRSQAAPLQVFTGLIRSQGWVHSYHKMWRGETTCLAFVFLKQLLHQIFLQTSGRHEAQLTPSGIQRKRETSRNIKKHHVNFINFDMRKRSSGRICSFRFCRLEVGDSFTGSMSNALSSCKYGRMWHMAVTSHRKRCIKMSSWWRVLTLQNLPGCERLQLGTDASSSHPESPSSSKPLFTATTCNDWFQDVSGFNMVQYV